MNPKLDPGLAARLEGLDTADPVARQHIRVLVRLTDSGDASALQPAGLHVELVTGELAVGSIALGDLEALAELDAVVTVGRDRETLPDLHDSVPEIHADHVRTGALGLTGTNVIVGVVDTGIDIFHHAFRKADGTTRLLSLLDTTILNTISMTGAPTAGTFQLSWRPSRPTGGASPAVQTTANIAFNATAATVRQALEALAAIDPGDVLVTGGPLPGTPITAHFAGRYLNKAVRQLDAPFAGQALTPAAAAVTVRREREYSDEDIDAALTTPGMPFDSVDTDGHGTHVMGIAAGDGSQSGNCHGAEYYVGVAPGADLIAVKAPTVADKIRGVQYIFARATALNKAAVVNISSGYQLGAHDGTEDDERVYDTMLAGTTGRAIVKSAGNDGALYDHDRPREEPRSGGGLHARKHIAANGFATLDIVISPGDRVADEFVLWYDGAGRLDLQLREPGGATLAAPVHPNDPVVRGPLANHPLDIRSQLAVPQNGKHRIALEIDPRPAGTIAKGSWRLTLTETAGAAVDVDCWIDLEREDPHPRFADADQDRTRTISMPGTARNVITVGSYDPRDSALAPTSSRGPTADAPRLDPVTGATLRKPEICAPGVGITAAHSRGRDPAICCDCCSDFYVVQSGTSMAAPHVTGIVALMFERNRTLTFDQVRAHLVASCRPPDPITGPTLPNDEWGAGKVDAEAAASRFQPQAAGDQELPSARPRPLLRAVADDEPPILPPAAYPGAYLPTEARIRNLQQRTGASPAGQLAGALISTHVDEVLRLIETNRRVALAWHRMQGPVLLRRLMLADVDDGPVLPRSVCEVPVDAGLERLLDELERCAGPALRADIARQRAFMLSLPGARLEELDLLRGAV